MREFEFIRYLKKAVPKQLQGKIGIGDDADLISLQSRTKAKGLLFASDVIVDGVDFRIEKDSPELVGRKALAINLSDLAAMGGKPVACVVSLGLPRGIKNSWIKNFYRGLIKLAGRHRVVIAGGDISSSRCFFCSVAVIGQTVAESGIRRNGAQAGDWIGVTGHLGGSIAGKHLRFTPRLAEAEYLARSFRVHSMIDISDGLLQDLEHILEASRVSADIFLDQIPYSPGIFKTFREALGHALSDGEDFELLLTVSEEDKRRLEKKWKRKFPKVPLSWIGRIRKARGKNTVFFRNGRPVPFKNKSKGFTHFL